MLFARPYAARRGRNWQRLQAVLRDRFKLVLRLETHELPVYALVADEKGLKLSRSADGKPSSFLGPAGRLNATAQPIGRLTTFLSAEQLALDQFDAYVAESAG